MQPESLPPQPNFSADERMQVYARALWLGEHYATLFRAEARPELLSSLTAAYTSAHTRRLMQENSLHGEATRRRVESRLAACIGFLERSRDRRHVPLNQAAKAIAFKASGVTTSVWVAERKQQRVVGRQYALDLLAQMVECRPPPPFEQHDSALIASIGFDQTYAKAGAGTGTSAYNPIQTVDAAGRRQGVERMVYINGQYFPVPVSAVSLSAEAIARIRSTGPYTQDFRRILPHLQPYRMDGVMDAFVRRATRLLGAAPASTREAMDRLLSRPDDDRIPAVRRTSRT